MKGGGSDGLSGWARLKNSAYLARRAFGQARVPFRPLPALREAQARRIKAMLAFAYATVPYYRSAMDRLHLRAEDFRGEEDLARLPVIEPEQLQQDGPAFVSSARPMDRYVRLLTGGSTGDPRVVYYTPEAIFENAAHAERERCMIAALIGRKYGYRETVIASGQCTGLELQRFTHARAILPSRLQIHRQYILLTDPPEKNVRLINEFRPDVIQSYGSYLGILFPHLADTGAAFHRPRAVTYSSDGLPDSTRRLIRERFDIPVFSTYQAIEALKIGFECECHTGLHLNVDLFPVRVVDGSGRNLPPGVTGEVIVSNLVNRGTVLLNYRLGDLAALLPEPCPCGRTLPLLSFPPGRSDDQVELPSGRLAHSDLLRTVFTGEELVRQFQVVQQSAAGFTVKVVVAPAADPRLMRERFVQRFRERFGPEVQVDIAFVDAIERTAGGKFRAVIRSHRRPPIGS